MKKENCVMRNFIICIFQQTEYYYCDQAKEDQMARACGSNSYKTVVQKPEETI